MDTRGTETEAEFLERVMHHLLGKLHLEQAGTGGPTRREWELINDLTEWWEAEGEALVAARKAKSD